MNKSPHDFSRSEMMVSSVNIDHVIIGFNAFADRSKAWLFISMSISYPVHYFSVLKLGMMFVTFYVVS